MPSRPFSVRSARRAPPGMEMVTTMSRAPASARAAAIMARGPGLIAGSPGAIGRPGRVAVPTPSPATKVRPEPGAPGSSRTTTVAPWVTSGSSPASLTTAASAQPGPRASRATANSGRWPPGSGISTADGTVPPPRPSAAAFAAAAAQAPVVQPRRSGAASVIACRPDAYDREKPPVKWSRLCASVRSRSLRRVPPPCPSSAAWRSPSRSSCCSAWSSDRR